jgi:hypothetical protein
VENLLFQKQDEIGTVTESLDDLTKYNTHADKKNVYYAYKITKNLREIEKVLESARFLQPEEMEFLKKYQSAFSSHRQRNQYSVSFDEFISLFDLGAKASLARILLERTELFNSTDNLPIRKLIFSTFFLLHSALHRIKIDEIVTARSQKVRVRKISKYLKQIHDFVFYLTKAYGMKFKFIQDPQSMLLDEIVELNQQIDKFVLKTDSVDIFGADEIDSPHGLYA